MKPPPPVQAGHARPRRRDDEDGTVLVLALAFMVVWATVVFALLDLASTGFAVVGGADERTDRIHASEGAIELGIAILLDDPAPHDGACPQFPVAIAGQSVSLTCAMTQGPNVRLADLTATAGGTPQVRARVRLDDEQSPPVPEILNWTVLR